MIRRSFWFSGILVLLVALAEAAPGPAPLTARERAQGFRDTTVLVKPRADRRSQIDAEESSGRLRTRRKFSRFGDLRVVDVNPGENALGAIRRLKATGLYEFVEPDFVKHRAALPDDPRFTAGEQWSLRNTGQAGGLAGADIGAVAAWDTRTDASTVIVAVIDTGIHATHEDLAGNLWTNPDEITGNGIDDDGNGYVDDVHGINSLALAGTPASGNPDDDAGHGTRVAGVIAAAGNNGKGLTGVAWKARIMSLKFDDAEGSAVASNEVECIDYALRKGARVINISYSAFFYSQAEYDAIKRARDAGVIVVAAAGNDTFDNDLVPGYPANYLLDNVLTVAATDRHDALSTFSNYGVGTVDLAAPGAEIMTTDRAGDTSYLSVDGTSFSAPMVVGGLALLRAQFPNDSYRASINRLLRSVDPLPALAGKVATGGRMNLARALSAGSGRPFNDDFAARVPLTGASIALRTNTQQASPETGEPAHAGTPAGATVWCSWTAPASGPAAVETSDAAFDTVVAVYTGTALDALITVAANDDAAGVTTSRATFAAVAGTTYQIAVGGKADAAGPLVLTVGFVPPNDDFAAATILTGPSMRATGYNTMSGHEPSEPAATSAAHHRSVWYRWVAPASDYYSFSVFAYGFDAVAAVYTGASLGSLTQLATGSTANYNDAGAFDAQAGRVYYFQIDSADGNAGLFNFAIIDGVAIGGILPVNSTPAYSPASGYAITADTYGGLIFVNATTGDIQFGELTGTLDVQSPALAIDGTMYIGDEYGYLYAYSPNGTPRWRKDLGLVQVTSSPAVGPDGTIFVHTDDGYLQAFYPDGAVKWHAAVPGESYSSPAIANDGTIYIGAEDQNLYALSSVDGALKWRFKADGEIYSSPAIGTDGTIYFGTLNGKFYAVSPGGVAKWTYTAGGAISSSAAIGFAGTLYFGCYDTNVYALTAGGQLSWKYRTGDEIRGSSPAVATNGTIYIGSYDGFIHAISQVGTFSRNYATGAYIRASPLLVEHSFLTGSGDGRIYVASIPGDPADTAWPMYRQNSRHSGHQRNLNLPPTLLAANPMRAVTPGTTARLDANPEGAEPLSYQWRYNGTDIAGAAQPTLDVAAVSNANVGIYTVTVTNVNGAVTSAPMIVGLTSSAKLIGTGTEFPNILHPNGNVFDQILLGSAVATVTADPGQILRMSYLDLNNDIIQVEFTGAGTLTLMLDTVSGPAAPVNYNQDTNYMKGRGSVIVTGADETTNLSIFSVGRANAVNLALFKDSVTYDGFADIGYVAISSRNGRFGGLRTADAIYSANQGPVGVYAPGVTFAGPVYVGDINAQDSASPFLMIGGGDDVRITGGDMLQTNNRAVVVSGISRLTFTAGTTSHGAALDAQHNRARFEAGGVDVTSQIVVNPP